MDAEELDRLYRTMYKRVRMEYGGAVDMHTINKGWKGAFRRYAVMAYSIGMMDRNTYQLFMNR
tara:strand:+ start:323 stop:511 length:189 start_codon:yes stop_codon:yes gene_type:complete